MEIVAQIFQICIIPILGILTKYIVDYLSIQRDKLKNQINDDTAKKYLDMIHDTVEECVITTNQTYVNTLKEQGKFDEAAQKEAFQRTLDAVLAILTDDVKDYIKEATGDVQTYLTSLIESQVNYHRK